MGVVRSFRLLFGGTAMQPFSLFGWMTGLEASAVLTVRLYSSRTDPMVPDPQVSDFSESDFAGYLRAPWPSYTLTTLLPDGTAYLGFPTLYWLWGLRGLGQDARGAFYVALREDLTEVVVGYGDFDAPQQMAQAGDTIIASVGVTAQGYLVQV